MSEATGRPGTPAPTPEDRLRLIQTLAARAYRRTDPMGANLEAMAADVMQFVHTLTGRVQADLEALAAGGCADQLTRLPELYLKLARQVDRLAQAARPGPPVPVAPPGTGLASG
ncbi:MAG TPA: hypothetical protein VM597_27490 [Gemmataceae bacterium]|nr:hypothetical protein [Gemmataceae bacterium]